MERPGRGRLPHAVPSWVSEGSFFFVTINCEPRDQNHLCQTAVGESVLAAAAYNHEHLVWHCRILLLMPDHIHGILAFPREPGLKTVVTNWKKHLARHQNISWQRDFFDHRLRNAAEETEKLDYTLRNPVRKNFCPRPEDWRWVYRPSTRPPPGA